MPEQKTVSCEGKIIAHVFFSNISSDGVKFLTPPEYTLQLGLIQHPKGKIIRNHIHRQDIKYNVDTTQEFLYIEKGKVKIKFFSDAWKPLESVILNKGDFVLFISGGHGLEVLQKCRIIEIKQGPYPGDKFCKIFQDDNSSK